MPSTTSSTFEGVRFALGEEKEFLEIDRKAVFDNFQLNVGEYGIFVTNVPSASPARMDVGVGWDVDPRTRDWDESDRHQEVHGFVLVNGAWTEIETGDRWSEATIVDWAVATLQDKLFAPPVNFT